MSEIRISDVTIQKAGENAGYNLSFKEKLELAKLLDRLCVPVIELGRIEKTKADSLLVKSVAAAVQDACVAVPLGPAEEEADLVWNALKNAKHPRMQVCAPVSPVQMEYLYHKKPAAMAEAVKKAVARCRSYTEHVEFEAIDATRADEEFLYSILTAAIEAGASVVTVCDTAGRLLPAQWEVFLKDLKENVPELEKVTLGVSCSSSLFMANACSMSAVFSGAAEVKAAAYRTDGADLFALAVILHEKGEAFGLTSGINAARLRRTVTQIRRICESDRLHRGMNSGEEETAEASVLSIHDGKDAVMAEVGKLGYDLSEEDEEKVFETFRRIAAKKEQVSLKELDAIVAAEAMQVPPTYTLVNYVITTGNSISASAHMLLKKGDKVLEGLSLGDGSIDAVFQAIEQTCGRHFELDDFRILAVTEGRGAAGEALVRLRLRDKVFSGRGISTDIVEASILAYINAMNKIVYEEEEA